MYNFVLVFGWSMAHLPKFMSRSLCWVLGAIFYKIPSKRKRIICSNLHHAFPDRSKKWLKDTVWNVTQRSAEMAVFTIACPHFSVEQLCNVLEVDESTDREFEAILREDRPILIVSAHSTMNEAFSAWPVKARFKFPEMAIFYRPRRDKKADDLVVKNRNRFGIQMFSRREGIRATGELMRRKGIVAVLFDQNTRDAGHLVPFFGRVTSATDLHGLLAKKYNAIPVYLESNRTSFWKAKLEFQRLECELTPKAITLESNRLLEDRLTNSQELLENWLWAHNRWKILHRPNERLGMVHKKKMVDFHEYPERKTRFALVLNDCLDTKAESALINFLKTLRKSRPDASLRLIANDATGFAQKHQGTDLIDISNDLPPSTSGQNQLASALADEYLDLVLVLEDNQALQRFAKRTQTPQRFGVSLDNSKAKSKNLTHSWQPEAPQKWRENPEWIKFGKQFGLQVEV